ncbi:hypothetical protein EEB15_29125 [Ramlibacter sp. WS9]|nr:hypothetical protein EEB15_29125 [Ramlibacter sp. WS9]
MSSNGHFNPPLPTSEAALALRALLDRASALRAEGRETDAVACGPAILEAYFEAEQSRAINRRDPRGFTEKLFCRMLDVHEQGCPTYSRLSDKLAVRDFVAGRVGERFLTPVLWSGDDAREIPWERLPPEILLKCNEGSGKGARLAAPYQPEAAQALALRWQSQSYYWFRREFHYWDVPRRLLVDERLDDGHPDGPIDYIFFCFDGVPRLAQVGSRSHTIHRFFTPDWEAVQLTYRERYETPHIPRPAVLSQMLEAAAALSAGFDFVRVDFYCCGNDIRFGELTFTPRAGWIHFKPAEWDMRLGDWWHYRGLPDA